VTKARDLITIGLQSKGRQFNTKGRAKKKKADKGKRTDRKPAHWFKKKKKELPQRRITISGNALEKKEGVNESL